MTKLIVLVGLPASGKSTWARENEPLLDAVIISSDKWRKDNFGEEEIQGNNHDIFESLHKQTRTQLELGNNVIFDATNLSYKHRIALLNKMPKNTFKECVLFATDFDICIVQNNNRERSIPKHVMERYYKSITIPQYNEGWDDIRIIFNYNRDNYSFGELFDRLDDFDQDNHNHSLTLGAHCKNTARIIKSKDARMYLAAMLHDIGKEKTKTYKTMKGVPTKDAHYYGHENVSAYDALFYLDYLENNYGLDRILCRCSVIDKLIYSCGLIQYHMRPYFTKTDKAKNKLLDLVGQEMYDDLLVLHEADKESH